MIFCSSCTTANRCTMCGTRLIGATHVCEARVQVDRADWFWISVRAARTTVRGITGNPSYATHYFVSFAFFCRGALPSLAARLGIAVALQCA
jgi:hypothetical protein